jgi:multicomponent Na+:H+ antiporter subunit A
MVAALATIFLLAVLAPALTGWLRGATGWVLAVPVLAVTGWFATWLPEIAAGGVHLERQPWAPGLGLELSFRVDGWSLLFLLLIGGIGALVLIFAGGYLHGHPYEGRFHGFLLFFMGAMLGLVAADDLILLFVFWELTSLASYLLIGFDHEERESRAAALQALLVTGGGGLAMLAGLILLGQIGGGTSVTALLPHADAIRGHALYPPVLGLVLAGAFTKSAQTPFHFWLPGAMAAPTPVSAYLHSATMVKAGVFLLGRLHPVLGGTAVWHDVLAGVGALTMLTGAVLAIAQTDLKRLLAYSTVSALGTLTLLLGIGTTLALKAAAVFLLVHSLYKGALFMVAGIVDHEAGTRDVRALGGLFRAMPITAVAAGAAALSMSGFPPLLGFIGKELLYEAKLHAPDAARLLTAAGVSANLLMVAVALIVGFGPFHGARPASVRAHGEAPVALWLGPVVLALLGLVAGLFPGLVDRPLLAAAVGALRGEETQVVLKLWHGINPVLLLSIATVAAGVLVFTLRERVRRLAAWLAPLAQWGPERGYERALKGMIALAGAQTRLLQHGYLRGYVLTVIAVATALAGFALVRFGPVPLWIGFAGVRVHEVLIAGLILAGALLAARARSRLVAVTGLSVVGYGVALLYALYGAPDLALTQILVETLTLVLFVLVVVHLPRFSQLSSPRRRAVDAVIAGAAGLVITLLVLKALHVETGPRVSEYHTANALAAHGRNVVNVTLVDFRALDTLGEIVVLGMAAIGAVALLQLRPERRKEDE